MIVFRAAAAEFGELTQDSFRKLRERLEVEKIDLTRATISRVEVSGDCIEMVDVFRPQRQDVPAPLLGDRVARHLQPARHRQVAALALK
jgi:hypothetical protein